MQTNLYLTWLSSSKGLCLVNEVEEVGNKNKKRMEYEAVAMMLLVGDTIYFFVLLFITYL